MPADKDENRIQLGARLREMREYLGLSQDEVAEILKLSRSAISLIENGERKVEALELKRFAELYQRPVDYFTGQLPAGDPMDEDVKHLARAASKLSHDDRQELLRFAEFLQTKPKLGSKRT